MKGTVKFFNTSKGFGFIAGEDGKEYFVHVSAIAEGTTIKDNDAVTFDVVQGDKGPKADKVALAGAAPAAAEDDAADEVPEDDAADESDEE